MPRRGSPVYLSGHLDNHRKRPDDPVCAEADGAAHGALKYGTYIIVLSILAGINVLGLIGGALALTHNPTPNQPTQPYQPYTQPTQPQIEGYCRLCGGPLTADSQFCPHCGQQVKPPP
ncbi:MAG: hypothetical protein NWE93_12810 [Candidatus Bathyarchaeota archaeon]|nr:hypothetical protein [Candidatus Bathyarchaeota archaeon]